MTRPAYLDLPEGELGRRAVEAVAALQHCRLCPRDCGVDRVRGKWAACKTGRHAVVSSAFPHFGEEDCLRGWNGSGTIFFGHCNLRCKFCQNFDISQAIPPRQDDAALRPEQIARVMLGLQARGCHNVNFVTPEHVVPQVLEAVAAAVPLGLRVPLVYNTSAYDSMESLGWMDGVVDIYMPDFKLWSPEASKRYLMAEDYPEVARRVIAEMHRQAGPLRVDDEGLATRGLLIRHLVMPGMLEESRRVLEWIVDTLGPDTYVNLMDQYHPAGRVSADTLPEINRRPGPEELEDARRIARDLGLRRLDERRPHPRLRRRLLVVG
jgi:putative pyruvate formate lyase activating enzyme